MQSRTSHLALLVGGTITVLLAGCTSQGHVTEPAAPKIASRSGVSLAGVTYAPAAAGKVRPNQIANTALGKVFVDGRVDLILRETLADVLHHAGFNTEQPAGELSAEITDFSVDDLGLGVDWILHVRYTVRDETGRTLYEAAKVSRRRTAKFVDVAQACDDLLRLNATELVVDDTFRDAVR